MASALALLLGAVVFFTGCEEDEYYEGDGYEEASGGGAVLRSVKREGSTGTYTNSSIPQYGSSGKLEGTIAVVTILADDSTGTWELSEEGDFQVYSRIYSDLNIGCDWITQACAEYGREVSFVWDWVQHEELIYRTSLNMDIGKNPTGAWKHMCEFISNNIDSEGIKRDLGANGIIYMVCVDSPSSNTLPSTTIKWESAVPVEYEMCFMMMQHNGDVKPPAAFAHEMLHTFGAADLYFAGKRGITQEYVDYVKSEGLNDIMRITWNPDNGRYVYDSVLNGITDITAYYIGLTDYSETVQTWGFEQSDYVLSPESDGSFGDTDSSGEEYSWWNMLDSRWEKSDWEYEDGEWYIWDEETQFFYIYMEDYDLFAAMDEEDNVYWFDSESNQWIEE